MSLLLVLSSSMSAWAATEAQRKDVMKNSPLHDEELLEGCFSGTEETQSTAVGSPGEVFLLGDSLSFGVKDFLPAALSVTEGWSMSGSDTVSSRTLNRGENSGTNAAAASKDGLSAAKHVVVMLGTNQSDASKEDIGEVVKAIKDAPSSASISWVSVNTGDGSGVDDEAFNTTLSGVSGINIIENTVNSWEDDQKVHYGPEGYTALAQVIANDLKGSSSPATDSNTVEGLEELTPRQKVAKLVFIKADGATLSVADAVNAGVGGIFVRSGDKNDAALYNSISAAVSGKQVMVSVDFEGGNVQAPGASITGALPTAAAMGQMSTEELTALAKDMGGKLKALGINMDFAPVADIGGGNSLIAQQDRAFATTPEGVIDKAGAFAEGLRQAGVTPVLKHFPGHGSAPGDSHSGQVTTPALATLEARDILPFKELSSGGQAAIMMGHLKVPEWGGTPATLNPKAYDYVRKNLLFSGVIVTDALDMQGIDASFGGEPDRAVWAIAAGADMALVNTPSNLNATLDKLEAAVNNGTITQDRLNESIGRIQAVNNGTGSELTSNSTACTCTTGAAANIAVDKGFSLGTEAAGRRSALMQALMNDLGITAAQAAGIVGNFTQESGGADLPPDVNEGGEKGPPDMSRDRGYGWAQWTHINGSRKTQLVTFAIESGYVQGEVPSGGGEPTTSENLTDAANYSFLKKELSEGYADALTNLTKETTATKAAWVFHRDYEGSADSEAQIGERGADAEKWLSEYEASGGVSIGSSGSSCGGSASSNGETTFPLIINKNQIGNKASFRDGTFESGHPYTAFDIHLAESAPETPVVAFANGVVTKIDDDGACNGGLQSIQIFDDKKDEDASNDTTVFYTHLKGGSVLVSEDDEVTMGTPIASIATAAEIKALNLEDGCSIAHLHIDQVRGDVRPSCSRSSCSAENSAKFIDIGPDLFSTYEMLPEGNDD